MADKLHDRVRQIEHQSLLTKIALQKLQFGSSTTIVTGKGDDFDFDDEKCIFEFQKYSDKKSLFTIKITGYVTESYILMGVEASDGKPKAFSINTKKDNGGFTYDGLIRTEDNKDIKVKGKARGNHMSLVTVVNVLASKIPDFTFFDIVESGSGGTSNDVRAHAIRGKETGDGDEDGFSEHHNEDTDQEASDEDKGSDDEVESSKDKDSDEESDPDETHDSAINSPIADGDK